MQFRMICYNGFNNFSAYHEEPGAQVADLHNIAGFFTILHLVDNILDGQGLLGIQTPDYIFVRQTQLENFFWLKPNVCVDKHQVCAAWLKTQELGHQTVATTWNQTFVYHGIHSVAHADLVGRIHELQHADEKTFGELTAIAGHTEVKSKRAEFGDVVLS